MKIKAIIKYHFTPVTMAIIKKAEDQVLMRMWRKRNACNIFSSNQKALKYGFRIEISFRKEISQGHRI